MPVLTRRSFLFTAGASVAALALPRLDVAAVDVAGLKVRARLVQPGTPHHMSWICSLSYWRERVVPTIPEGYELAFLEVEPW